MWHQADPERLVILTLVYILVRIVFDPLLNDLLEKDSEERRERKKRQWKPKSPEDCPSCKAGVHMSIRPIRRQAQPWSERKSNRGRKKKIATAGYACLNEGCDYFGVTDDKVHALVGNGKRGKQSDIQTFKCQCCQASFSAHRNTPFYYLKTDTEHVGQCLWLLAEGVDVAVVVRFTGHVEATLGRWLSRAGKHGAIFHALRAINLTPAYLQMDELHAPVANNPRKSWLWVAIDPVTKLIPAIHLGGRTNVDAYQFVHDLQLRLADGVIPAFTTDGIRAYFFALTAHFGNWVGSTWVVSLMLVYGQLVKRRKKRKSDPTPYTITRMKCGKRWQLFQVLDDLGFNPTIQTAFIERVNLTIRQGVAGLRRRTWCKARSQQTLLLHVQWWQTYYNFARPHQSLRQRLPGLARRYRARTPAMAAGLTDHVWTVHDLLNQPLIYEQGGACLPA